MKAIAFNEFGSPEVLSLVEVPLPEPGPGQVRVRVQAAGVNPADWKIRSGELSFGPPKFPQFPGGEAAGVVDAVGSGAHWSVGDEVLGWVSGGYAEFALASELAGKPGGLAWADAAALPVAVSTADRALGLVEARSGETLLINGASGAVGSIAAQLARAAGVTVIGTASAKNQDLVAALGITPVVYGDGLVDRVRAVAPNGVSAAIDAAGHGFLPAAVELAGGPERVMTLVDPEAGKLGVAASFGGGGARPTELLERVAASVADGSLRLVSAPRVYPLAEAAQAQAAGAAGQGTGKLVLLP